MKGRKRKGAMSPTDFIRRAEEMSQALRPALQDARLDIGVEAKKHFDRSFLHEGFTDSRLEKWPKRNPDRRPQDPTLYETGKLSSGTRVRILARGVAIINKVKYGAYHNYGIGQKVRRFIGNSVVLNRRITTILVRRIKIALTGGLD